MTWLSILLIKTHITEEPGHKLSYFDPNKELSLALTHPRLALVRYCTRKAEPLPMEVTHQQKNSYKKYKMNYKQLYLATSAFLDM